MTKPDPKAVCDCTYCDQRKALIPKAEGVADATIGVSQACYTRNKLYRMGWSRAARAPSLPATDGAKRALWDRTFHREMQALAYRQGLIGYDPALLEPLPLTYREAA